MVRSSLRILALLFLNCSTSFDNQEELIFKPFEIDGCSPSIANAQSELYDKVRLDFQLELPLKLIPFEKNTTHDFDRTAKLQQRNVTIKKFTPNCETVFIFLPSSQNDSITFLNATNTLNFMLNAHALKRDRAVFISRSTSRSYDLTISKTLVASRLKHIYFFSVGESYLRDTRQLRSMFRINYSKNDYSISSIIENLNGRHLKVTAIRLEPYVLMRGDTPIGGFLYNLIEASSAAYNFTFDYECPPFRGIVLTNGTFNSPVGDAVSAEKDIVLGTIYTRDRSLYLDFSDFGILNGFNYLSALPKTIIHWNAILGTFQPAVWSLLCCTVILLVVLLYAVSHVGSMDPHFGFFKIFNMIVSPLLEKSFQDPKSGKVRIMAIPWMVMSIITLTYFKSDFIAFLTNPEVEYVPSTNAELAADPEYTIRIKWINGAEAEFFRTAISPVHLNIRSRLVRDDDMLECLESTAFDYKTVCMYYDIFRENYIAKNMTLRSGFQLFTKSKEHVFPTLLSMGFPKDSKYVLSFSRITGFLRDTGLLQRWVQEVLDTRRSEGRHWLIESKSSLYHQLKHQLKEQFSTSINPLQFTNLYGGFAALFFAATAAVITLACEHLIEKFSKHGQFHAQSSIMQTQSVVRWELWTSANNFTLRELNILGNEVNTAASNVIIVQPQEPTVSLGTSYSGEGSSMHESTNESS